MPPVNPSKLDCLKLANALCIKTQTAVLTFFSNCVFSFWSKKLLHPVLARFALGLGGERGGLLGRQERQSPAVVHGPVISSNEKKILLLSS